MPDPATWAYWSFNAALAAGVLAVALLAIPLTAPELQLSPSPPAERTNKNVKVVALFVAWLVDAVWFTLPAAAIILAICAWKVNASSSDFDFDAVKAPEAVLLRSFLVALNPVWFFLIETFDLIKAAAAPNTGYVFKFARVVIELLLPLCLYFTYSASLPYFRASGSAIVDYQNRSNGQRGILSMLLLGIPRVVEIFSASDGALKKNIVPATEPAQAGALKQGSKNRLFFASVLLLVVFALIQTSANLTRIAQVSKVSERLRRSLVRPIETNDEKLLACMYVVKSFRYVPCSREKARCLTLVEAVASRLSRHNLVDGQVRIERAFVNSGSWIAPIPCKKMLPPVACWRTFVWGGQMYDRH